MTRAFKIPPLILCGAVMFLAVGELASGTDVLFVALMVVAMLSVGLAYNQLGGMSTMSGIMFAAFALRNIIISQFAKVLLFQAADRHIQVPILTISIYALFYFCALVGVYLFAGARFVLPKPAEPVTNQHYGLLYAFAFPAGLFGMILYEVNGAGYGEGANTVYNGWHSLGLALRPLLLFCIVLAVDMRLRRSEGRHSVDMLVALPWAIVTFIGLSDTQRVMTVSPTVVYFATCAFRGYRFHGRHYVTGVLGAVGFMLVLSPILLYARTFTSGLTWTGRIYQTAGVVNNVLHDPEMLLTIEGELAKSGGGDPEFSTYFSASGTSLLNRLSLIAQDSSVIYACSNGLHYGFRAIIIDFKGDIPSFLYKNKPHDMSGQDYIGRISGMSGEATGVTYPAISAVSDSFGAFGWLGVVVVPLIFFPALFILVENMFDMSRPWGTVAFGVYLTLFSEMMLGRFFELMIRYPVYLLLFSWMLSFLARVIPTRGDRRHRVIAKPRTTAIVGAD